MDYLSTFLKIPILQALGVVLIIGIAERMGIPIISLLKSLLKINGNGINGNGKKEERIDELEMHAKIANHEVGEINEKLKEIKADIKETHAYLREHAEDDKHFQIDILKAINDIK